MPGGDCQACGRYCDLGWACSPSCAAKLSGGDRCRECGTGEDVDPVYITCRPCLAEKLTPEQLRRHDATHDAQGRWKRPEGE